MKRVLFVLLSVCSVLLTHAESQWVEIYRLPAVIYSVDAHIIRTGSTVTYWVKYYDVKSGQSDQYPVQLYCNLNLIRFQPLGIYYEKGVKKQIEANTEWSKMDLSNSNNQFERNIVCSGGLR